VAEDGNGRAAKNSLPRKKGPSQSRGHTEGVEEIRRYEGGADPLGLVSPCHQDLRVKNVKSSHLLEHRQAILIIPKVLVREGVLGDLIARLPSPNQAVGFREREGT